MSEVERDKTVFNEGAVLTILPVRSRNFTLKPLKVMLLLTELGVK